MSIFKKILVYFLILTTIFFIIAFSYFYAYNRTKRELVNFLYKRWGERVKIEDYRFNLFKGIFFKKIEVEKLFYIRNLKIRYDLISLIKKKSIGNISVDTFLLSTQIFRESTDKTAGKIKVISVPAFKVEGFKIAFFELMDKKKSYILKNIEGFLRLDKNKKFLCFLHLYFIKPYLPFYLKVIVEGDSKTQIFKILELKSDVFRTSGEIVVNYPFLKIKARKLKIREFYFPYVESKLRIKNNNLDVIYIEGKEKRMEFCASGKVKNFNNFNKAILDLVSYAKGTYTFRNHDYDFEIINESKISRTTFQSNIYIEKLNVDNTGEINGFGKLSLLPAEKVLKIDTMNFKYKGISVALSGKYPGEIKLKINIDRENDFPFFKVKEGEILGIYRTSGKRYTFAAYGKLNDVKYKDFEVSKFNFTVGRDTLGEDFITMGLDSISYKRFLIGGFELNLKRKDSLFFFRSLLTTSFAGIFEDKGIIIKKKNYYSLTDSLDRVKMNISRRIVEISLNKIEIVGGQISSNLYIDFENKGIITNIAARNLHLEKVRLNKDIWVSGKFNFDFDFKGTTDTFTLNASLTADTFEIKGFKSYNLSFRGYGDREKITIELKSKMEDGNIKIYGILSPLNNGFSKPQYELEIAVDNVSIKELQNLFRMNFINFEKGRIFANFKVKNGKVEGDMVLEKAAGEFLYTLSPFHKSFMFIRIEENKINGRFNGYSGKGTFRGWFQSILRKGKMKDLKTKIKFENIPLIYGFIESRGSGTMTYSIDKNIKKLTLDSKIEEAFIVPLFHKKEEKKPSPSDFLFDLRFTSEGKIFLFNEWIDAELKGEIRVKKTEPIHYYLAGELEVIQGKIFYLGNVFEIKEGRIFFGAEPEISPEVNLRAELPYIVKNKNIRIILEITGKLNKPIFKIYSEPLAFDESTLIKYLTLGKIGEKPFSEIGTKGMYIGEKFLSAQVKKEARIVEFSLTGEGNPSILFGTYISPQLYIKYQHDFLSYYKDSFLIKYFLDPKFSLYSKRERSGEMVTGVEFEFRF